MARYTTLRLQLPFALTISASTHTEEHAMSSIWSFTKHLVGAMFKGFLYTGVVAAILCAVVLFVMVPGHQVTLDTSAAFAIVIALLAGALGAAVALIYHLSHLDGIHHAVQHLSELRASRSDRQSSTR
jgi:lysylphosphatidylglycerol synthetase-like protein (DUF2156 family)